MDYEDTDCLDVSWDNLDNLFLEWKRKEIE